MTNDTNSPHGDGWVALMRGSDAEELMAASPNAYALASTIALRANWKGGFNRHGCEYGEAMLGDYRSYGMSEQQYRTAKKKLEKWGFATFRKTNKGTIGKLTGTRLFTLSFAAGNGQGNTPATDSQRTANEPATDNQRLTNKETSKPSEYTHTQDGGGGVAGVAKCSVGNTEHASVTPEEIFEAYPRKVARPDALEAISKALSKICPGCLLERTKQFAEMRGGNLDAVPKVPNPTKWFDQERFNDEPSTWRAMETPPPVNSRNAGTFNEGKHKDYAGIGVVTAGNPRPRVDRNAGTANQFSSNDYSNVGTV